MLEMIDIGIENAVVYRVKGKITEDEMMSVLSIFKEKIQNNKKVNIYQEIVSVGGVEFDAIIEKLNFFVNSDCPISMKLPAASGRGIKTD